MHHNLSGLLPPPNILLQSHEKLFLQTVSILLNLTHTDTCLKSNSFRSKYLFSSTGLTLTTHRRP